MQRSCLHLHEYSGQFTCLECPDCISVLPSSCGYYKSDSSSCVFSGLRHAQAHGLVTLSLLEQPSHLLLQHCGDGEKFCLGSWRLCHAQEMCCSEVTVPLFILPLWIVGTPSLGACPHVYKHQVEDGNESSIQDPWALHPQAGFSCMLFHSSAAPHWYSHHHACQSSWSKLTQ